MIVLLCMLLMKKEIMATNSPLRHSGDTENVCPIVKMVVIQSECIPLKKDERKNSFLCVQ